MGIPFPDKFGGIPRLFRVFLIVETLYPRPAARPVPHEFHVSPPHRLTIQAGDFHGALPVKQ